MARNADEHDLGALGPRLDPPPDEAVLATLEPRDDWDAIRVVGADFSGATASHLDISGRELVRLRLTGADLEHLRGIDTRLRECDLAGTALQHASMQRMELHGCRMSGLVLSNARLRHTRFVGCKLDDANLRFVDAEDVVFGDCSLPGPTSPVRRSHECRCSRATCRKRSSPTLTWTP